MHVFKLPKPLRIALNRRRLPKRAVAELVADLSDGPKADPGLEFAIDAFGVDRCMFASNFPVDSAFGSFDDLYDTFSAVAAGVDAAARDKLFAGNAERVYRL